MSAITPSDVDNENDAVSDGQAGQEALNFLDWHPCRITPTLHLTHITVCGLLISETCVEIHHGIQHFAAI
jgi:hypothetical protein